jgi:four helix bundle protein
MTPGELQERATKFALDVTRMLRQRPRSPENDHVGDQLGRAARRAASNYRATCRARSRAEFVAKLGTVCEEIDESEFWLSFITQSGMEQNADLTRLLEESRQLRAIFAASYRTARGRLRGQSIDDAQAPKSAVRKTRIAKSANKQTDSSVNDQINKSITRSPNHQINK